jgi:hypothetical protein
MTAEFESLADFYDLMSVAKKTITSATEVLRNSAETIPS